MARLGPVDVFLAAGNIGNLLCFSGCKKGRKGEISLPVRASERNILFARPFERFT